MLCYSLTVLAVKISKDQPEYQHFGARRAKVGHLKVGPKSLSYTLSVRAHTIQEEPDLYIAFNVYFCIEI